jgi:ABC-type transporter Mla MlaB component
MEHGSAARDSLGFELVHAARLRLSGTVQNAAARTEFRRRIQQLDVRIRGGELTTFTVDVRKLDFVDSSALRLFIDWVSLAQSGGYSLVFLVDSAITWHRLSFSVLKSLAPATVRIVEDDPEGGQIAHGTPSKHTRG